MEPSSKMIVGHSCSMRTARVAMKRPLAEILAPNLLMASKIGGNYSANNSSAAADGLVAHCEMQSTRAKHQSGHNEEVEPWERKVQDEYQHLLQLQHVLDQRRQLHAKRNLNKIKKRQLRVRQNKHINFLEAIAEGGEDDAVMAPVEVLPKAIEFTLHRKVKKDDAGAALPGERKYPVRRIIPGASLTGSPDFRSPDHRRHFRWTSAEGNRAARIRTAVR